MYRTKKSNVVAISRGETHVIPVEIVIDKFLESYKIVLGEGDYIYFGLMEPNHTFDEAILKKEYTASDISPDGFLNILIRPEDTSCLDPGTYYYSVKVLYYLSETDVRITTLIDNTKFIITE